MDIKLNNLEVNYVKKAIKLIESDETDCCFWALFLSSSPHNSGFVDLDYKFESFFFEPIENSKVHWEYIKNNLNTKKEKVIALELFKEACKEYNFKGGI